MKLSKIDFGGWTAASTKARLAVNDSDDGKAFREALRLGLLAKDEAAAYFEQNRDDLDHLNTLTRYKEAVRDNKISVERAMPTIQRLQSFGPEIESQAKIIFGHKAEQAWSLGETVMRLALKLIEVERAEDLESQQALFAAVGVPPVQTELVTRWDRLRQDVVDRLAHLESPAGDLMRKHVTPHPGQSIFQLFE